MSRVGNKEKASTRNTAIAGATAGLVSRFIIAPLDVVKIRLQLQTHSRHAIPSEGPVYKGILPTIKTIVSQEGITGLWKGNIPAEVLYLTYGAAQMLAYRQTNIWITESGWEVSEGTKSFVAGAVGGGVATTVTYPLDLLRTRFAAQGGKKIYHSIAHSLRTIHTTEGTPGFFRGLTAAITQILPYMGLYFGIYEPTRTRLSRHLSSNYADSLSGGIAAVVCKTSVFPLDLIRRRLQVQGPTRLLYANRNIPIYVGVYRSARDIVKAEGVRGLYRGLTVSLLKAAPLSAFYMWTFEKVLKVMEWTEREG